MAAKEGVQSAVSNKCFELWLLLHIIDISSLNKEEQALLLLNERVSIKHTYTSKFMSEKMQEVLQVNWSKNKTNSKMLMQFVDTAVNRAKKITSNTDIPEGLGSNIYKIVEQIKMN